MDDSGLQGTGLSGNEADSAVRPTGVEPSSIESAALLDLAKARCPELVFVHRSLDRAQMDEEKT
jgi:hypothetical protein